MTELFTDERISVLWFLPTVAISALRSAAA